MLTLPLPPSTNNLFVNVPRRGRVPSSQYRAWKVAAGLTLNVQHPQAVTGPVEIRIHIPQRTRGDVDNRIKAVVDLLVTHGVIDDDKHVQSLTIARDTELGAGSCTVDVRASARKVA